MIRKAEPEDAPALLEIYKEYIDTPITFEYELPSDEEFRERIRSISSFYPYLVYESGGVIMGYAYAHRQKERAAYQWNAELSVYISKACTGRGIGRALYTALIEILKRQNIRTVYGCVTLPNAASEQLHKSMGFKEAGVHHHTGYKCGEWHDVAWFEKQIGEYGETPDDIIPIGNIDEKIMKSILCVTYQ